MAELHSAHFSPVPDKHILTSALTCSQEKEASSPFLLVVLGRPQAEMLGCRSGSVTQVRSLGVLYAP